jgi:hypothetical protein
MSMAVTLHAFPTDMSPDEAREVAEKKGNVFGRLLLRGRPVHEIRTFFVEYRILEYEAIHKPNIISRTFFADRENKRQLCRVIANGTTGGTAWAEELPEGLVEVTAAEENIQPCTMSEAKLEARGRKLVLRVLRRRIGGYPDIRLVGSRSIYRPYYVALYGEPVEGTKIHYLPIAADGWKTHRTF